MRTLLLAALLLAACARPASDRASDTASHTAAAAAEPPARVVERFYAERMGAKIDGAPDSAQLARIAPFISDTLRALLAAAHAVTVADTKRAPDEKPEFVEGDLFSSLFEGPTAYAVDSAAAPDGRVAVRLTRAADRAGDSATTWTDHAVVRDERGRRVIADIEYGGRWDFASKGTLRTSLEQALARPK